MRKTAMAHSGAHKPGYEFPRLSLLLFGLDLLLGRRPSFARDPRRVMEANPYPRRVEGLNNVPPEGSFILLMNHYNRPGLRRLARALATSPVGLTPEAAGSGRLAVPDDLPKDEQDQVAREQVMVAIGRLLPREYWGAYEAGIEQSMARSLHEVS